MLTYLQEEQEELEQYIHYFLGCGNYYYFD